MGTLPVSKLQVYANDYASFVDTIDEGWDRIGQDFYAQEEREHEVLWETFRKEIGSVPNDVLPGTQTLTVAARNAFLSQPEAIGALYAFEAQQPHTSASKLEGLDRHYEIPAAGKEYFVVHANDVAEVELLRSMLDGLSEAEFARAKNACAVVCSAMWGALDGIYYGSNTAAA